MTAGDRARTESVLFTLESDGRIAPRVRLREEEAPETPEAAPPTVGRYRVVREIARGGMGVVYRGRDVDLGREVAMKVLLDRHVERPELVQRFVEEAQIGGQLQHPGIVPIYELGLEDERRPFFSMKLVKGDNLADLLRAREEPGSGLHRFLGIFEQVCQTIAYAHSRGVVHRDLKPANIMVGAFGEVQVVDWGFAKVLARGGVADERKARKAREEQTLVETVRSAEDSSASTAGSVLGTLAYMPPEQALGRVDDLDERSDVFSLGAVLTEILTGRPPYTGESGSLVAEVTQSRLDEAFARLDACGAEREMTDLARDCLSPLRKDRPRDAGRLAERIGAYNASAEERAHRSALAGAEARAETARAEREVAERKAEAEAAHLRAEEARARAAEQRRARRQTFALAAAGLALLLVAGGVFVFLRAEREARRAEVARGVEDAIAEARAFEGQTRPDWVEAVAAARRADDLARSGDADPATAKRAAAVLADLEEKRRVATERATRRARNARLLDRLAEIRAGLIDDFNAELCDEEYRKAFLERGIDVAAASPREIAGYFRRGDDLLAFAAVFDTWARLNRLAGRDDAEKLDRTARAIDRDLWRNTLRAAAAERDAEAIRRLAAERGPDELDAHSLHLVVVSLVTAGDRRGALEVLEGKGPGVEDDLWLALLHAKLLSTVQPVEWRRVSLKYSAALALRPESPRIRAYLAWSLAQLGEVDDATALLEEAIRRNPSDHLLHGYLGNVLGRFTDRSERALEELRTAARLEPRQPAHYANMGHVHWLNKRPGLAIESYQTALKIRPDHPRANAQLAVILSTVERPESREEAMALVRKALRQARERGARPQGFVGSEPLLDALEAFEKVVGARGGDDREAALGRLLAAHCAALGDRPELARSLLREAEAWAEEQDPGPEFEERRRLVEALLERRGEK